MTNTRAAILAALSGLAAGGATWLSVIGAAGDFIVPSEGWVRTTYVDPAGHATVCAGNRSAALPGLTFTDDECWLLFLSDLIPHVIGIKKLIGDTSGFTLDDWVAMVSLSFNVGLQAFARSTLLAKFRAGDREGARAEFARWVHAGGEVLPGLVVRRALEAARMS